MSVFQKADSKDSPYHIEFPSVIPEIHWPHCYYQFSKSMRHKDVVQPASFLESLRGVEAFLKIKMAPGG